MNDSYMVQIKGQNRMEPMFIPDRIENTDSSECHDYFLHIGKDTKRKPSDKTI